MDMRKKIYPTRIKNKMCFLKKGKKCKCNFPVSRVILCCRFVWARVAHIPTSFPNPSPPPNQSSNLVSRPRPLPSLNFLPFFSFVYKGSVIRLGGSGSGLFQVWRVPSHHIISPNSHYLFSPTQTTPPSPLPFPHLPPHPTLQIQGEK